ncbi:MAG: vWA domain-containing protein [Armatimonadota bacterium]
MKLRVFSVHRCRVFLTALLLLFVFPNAVCAQPSDRRAVSFVILMDTSGSMTAYYQRRDPRPCLGVELAQNLITQIMKNGDRLVVLSFDRQLNDNPGEMLVLSSIVPVDAAEEIGRLRLTCKPGWGTMRTAALGRSIEALKALPARSDLEPGAIFYVITDVDTDRAPEGPDREFYESALRLAREGALTRLARIPQSGMILEVWLLKDERGAPPVSAAQVDAAREIVKKVITPQNPTPAAVLRDLERGGLVIHCENKIWQRRREGAVWTFEMPVTVRSRFHTLHWRGGITLNGSVASPGEKPQLVGNVKLILDRKAPLELHPHDRIGGILRVEITKPPRLWNLKPLEPQVRIRPVSKGDVTVEPSLFQAADPALEARISRLFWMSGHQMNAVVEPVKLPEVPTLKPPRIWQGLSVLVLLLWAYMCCFKIGAHPKHRLVLWLLAVVPYLAAIALKTGIVTFAATAVWQLLVYLTAVKFLHWKPFQVYYRLSGSGIKSKVELDWRRRDSKISDAGIILSRPGRERRFIVKPQSGFVLKDADGTERGELAFERTGNFEVWQSGGGAVSVSVGFDQNIPEPLPPRRAENA